MPHEGQYHRFDAAEKGSAGYVEDFHSVQVR